MLDVGAHDDDVARLQIGIAFQQVEDGVAQDLDLAAAAVTGVDPDAVVAGCEQRAGIGVACSGRRPVGPDVVLDPLQQGGLACMLRCGRFVSVCLGTAENELHLAGVAAP